MAQSPLIWRISVSDRSARSAPMRRKHPNVGWGVRVQNTFLALCRAWGKPLLFQAAGIGKNYGFYLLGTMRSSPAAPASLWAPASRICQDKLLETFTGIQSNIEVISGLYTDNGKENGNYYSLMGYMLGLY